MECLSEKTNEGIMGCEEGERFVLSPVIEIIKNNEPISPSPGNAGIVHEALDDILLFMKAALKGIGEGGTVYSETKEQMWRGAGSILEIAALLNRRLWQYSDQLSMEFIEKGQKVKAVSGARG